MPKAQKSVPQDFFDCGNWLNDLDDAGFAEEIISAEMTILSFLDSMHQDRMDLPFWNELAKAYVCVSLFEPSSRILLRGVLGNCLEALK